MTDIYDHHKITFGKVAAYVITDANGDRVATVAFKYPRDGAGRLYAYVHWIGVSMVRGFASGGGYDKATAACSSAAKKLRPLLAEFPPDSPAWAFHAAIVKDEGPYWHQQLERAGFRVLQAV